MVSDTIEALLRLPASERADSALALWDSLTDTELDAEVELTDEQRLELRRRVAEHDADPDSAISWDEIERQHRALG